MKHIELRLKQYKDLGYDIVESRKYVLGCAGTLIPSILELGTGKGHMAAEIARAGCSLTSVDNDSEMLEISRSWLIKHGLLDKVDLVCDNIENLKFPNNSFSTIVSIDLWHHLLNHEKALDEMFRVWNGNGKLIVSDMNREALDIVNQVHALEGKSHPEGKISIEKLEEILKKRKVYFHISEGKQQRVYVISIRS